MKRAVLLTAARLQDENADRNADVDLHDTSLSDGAFSRIAQDYLADADRMLVAAQAEYEFRQSEVQELLKKRGIK